MTESFFIGVLYYLQILKLCNKKWYTQAVGKNFSTETFVQLHDVFEIIMQKG